MFSRVVVVEPIGVADSRPVNLVIPAPASARINSGGNPCLTDEPSATKRKLVSLLVLHNNFRSLSKTLRSSRSAEPSRYIFRVQTEVHSFAIHGFLCRNDRPILSRTCHIVSSLSLDALFSVVCNCAINNFPIRLSDRERRRLRRQAAPTGVLPSPPAPSAAIPRSAKPNSPPARCDRRARQCALRPGS